jgi:hypothetical protein
MSAGLGRRVSTGAAARVLGCTRAHVLALAECGELEATDIRLPGKSRPRWVISTSSIYAFLGRRGEKEEIEETAALRVAGPRGEDRGE